MLMYSTHVGVEHNDPRVLDQPPRVQVVERWDGRVERHDPHGPYLQLTHRVHNRRRQLDARRCISCGAGDVQTGLSGG